MGGTGVKELLQYAAARGIRVHAAHLEPGVLGEWYADEAEIYFDITLTPNEASSVVAHELGHAHHGHACEDDAHAEAQADEYAARLLINPARLADLERDGATLHDMAEDLQVTEELVDVFLTRCLTRVRGITYTGARMGVGQWTHRVQFIN